MPKKKKATKQLPYRPCVGITLFSKTGKVWIGHRKPDASSLAHHFSWQMPQGGIDKEENPRNAALRELYEETNITTVTFLAEITEWLHYDFPDKAKPSLRKKYSGQKQKWFAFRFDGLESEINIDSPANGAHKPEFSAWRWEDIEKLPGLIVEFKRPVYQRVIEEFSKFVT